MNERQKRLNEVYEHLRQYYGIHTKGQFAESVQFGRTSMSAALNGNEKYLTDSLFEGICRKYTGVFNLNYLLTGNGELLLEHQEPEHHTSEPIDHSSLVNALLASKDETIAALNRQIATDQQLIASLRQQIDHLSRHTKFKDYPFEMGVADMGEPNPDQV